jgi:hypothetical protein
MTTRKNGVLEERVCQGQSGQDRDLAGKLKLKIEERFGVDHGVWLVMSGVDGLTCGSGPWVSAIDLNRAATRAWTA